jgi:glutamate/aspartate transport system ATP-binding protein
MISLKNVSKWYGHFQVLADCSTEVKKGEVVVVCGPSGSGKSTLIKTVNGLEPIQKGEITVNGIQVNDKRTDLAKLRSKVGMVFQHFELFPHLSIIDNLTLAQVKVLGREKSAAKSKGLKLLERVGLSSHTQINSQASSPAASSSVWLSPVRCAWILSQCYLTNPPRRSIQR